MVLPYIQNTEGYVLYDFSIHTNMLCAKLEEMKLYYFGLIVLTCLISCTNLEVEKRQVKEFNEKLNNEQLEVLELALKSFVSFLNENFNEKLTEKEKIVEFLKNITDTSSYRNWKFSDNISKEITEKYETSGLRKEYFYYQIEDSTGEKMVEFIGPVDEDFKEDSLMNFNAFGLYITALRNVSNPDSLLISYIDAKDAVGMISYELITSGLIYGINEYDYNIEIVKRIIIFEIYFDLLRWYSKQ